MTKLTHFPSFIAKLLQDPKVTDLFLNSSSQAFLDRGEGLEEVPLPEEIWTPNSIRDWILQLLSGVGKSWDAKYPFVDATLPSGFRLHVVFPPLSPQGILISLRRLSHPESAGSDLFGKPSPKELRRARWGDSPLFLRVVQAVQKGESVLISGATGSGKTTLAADLLSEIPGSQRIIALEDTPELRPQHPHFLSLISRPCNADGFGAISLGTLLKQTLRMRPDRIILGECRGGEVLDLLQALNTGHQGAMATLHANSPRDALRRIELLCLLASQGTLPPLVIRELLCLGIQWVVQVKREGPNRKISEMWRVEGREGDIILMRQVLG